MLLQPITNLIFSVIMDVVYNHVYQADEYAFEQIKLRLFLPL